ncbi:hypothetical protein Rs2_38936 [Raphanus sativus]|nr:hypothetical protein Rs2_38936 [Raphanus sativus]
MSNVVCSPGHFSDDCGRTRFFSLLSFTDTVAHRSYADFSSFPSPDLPLRLLLHSTLKYTEVSTSISSIIVCFNMVSTSLSGKYLPTSIRESPASDQTLIRTAFFNMWAWALVTIGGLGPNVNIKYASSPMVSCPVIYPSSSPFLMFISK